MYKCINELCNTQPKHISKYEGYCFRCFCDKYPKHELVMFHKIKELAVVKYIKSVYPHLQWRCDKIIGISRCRADIFIEFEDWCLIIEIDEYQHIRYSEDEEFDREWRLSVDMNGKPITFIRFNPDNYIDAEDVKHKSCFKDGVVVNVKDWNSRLRELKRTVDNCIRKPFTMRRTKRHYLFYDW